MRIWAMWVVMWVLVAMPVVAFGQPGIDGFESDDEVTLKVAKFGVGGAARLGDWAGIQVNLLDHGSSPRDLILRVAITDADGDETQYDRVVTATPGQPLSYWLYSWLPFRETGDGYEVRAYEAIETAATESNVLGYRAGKMLGRVQIQARPLDPSIAFLGIVGANQAGLNQYSVRTGRGNWSPFGHELNLSVSGLEISTLPDRWQGLIEFDALIWTQSSTDRSDPNRLTPEKARAIRTWVAAGGHLVVVLPPSGDPWFGSAHPLRTLMPEINRPQRREGVDFEEFRSFLTESVDIPLPKNGAVHVFTPADRAGPFDAMPILKDAKGDTIVIRRIFGSGAVTVVGLDLTHGQLRRVGLPDVEAFWHRVLGLRGPVKRIDQMTEQEKGDASNRSVHVFDVGVAAAIAKTGRAVQGVLFGLVVFVVYWVVAGPGGFFVLRKRKKLHHAWVAFVAAIGVFTALSWMGATALRPKTKDISHLTLFEQVEGQPTARARTWMSVMLPSYGTSSVSLDDPDADTLATGSALSGHLIVPWASPSTSGGLTEGYPDNTGYRVEARNPSSLRVPTRATVKDFRTDWVGTSRWSMPHPVGAVGDLDEPRLVLDGMKVKGLIRHGLPGAMTDVRIIVVNGQNRIRSPGQELGKQPIARTSVYAPVFLDDQWAAGEDLDLETVTGVARTNKQVVRNSYFTSAVRMGENAMAISTARTAPLVDRLIAARMMSQFDPPNYGVQNDVVGNRLARRRLMHGWDLGRWFTQPCVIVIGAVQIEHRDASVDGMPVPVYIDGKQVPSSGTTIVTWIYPLDANPPTPPAVLPASFVPAPQDPQETVEP